NYYRVLEEVAAEGKRMISSHLLAEREGITSAQVRKDLSSFGSFGRRGLGYHVEHLRDEIRALLGLDRRWRAFGVGPGPIGAALRRHDHEVREPVLPAPPRAPPCPSPPPRGAAPAGMTPGPRRAERSAVAAMLAATLLWGGTFVAIRDSVAAVAPATLVAWR